jgi:hypothetical protein
MPRVSVLEIGKRRVKQLVLSSKGALPMHQRLSVAFLSGALFLAGVVPAQANPPLTLGEQFALRSYTGQAMGLAITDVIKVKRVGILTNQSSI